MTEPINVDPNDELLPPRFGAMNEFIRTVCLGGEIEIQEGREPHPREPNQTLPRVNVQHKNRGAKLRIVRQADDVCVVVKLPPK